MEILSTPDMSVLSYIGIVLLLFGMALLFSAFGIVQIEKITVQSDKKAKIVGLVLLIVGGALILPEVINSQAGQPQKAVSTTQTPESALSAIATQPPTAAPIPVSDTPFFTDTFDGGLSDAWEVITGRFIVSENAPYLASGDVGLAVVGNPDWDNFAVEVDLIAPPRERRILGNGIGLIFAYHNTSSLDQHSFIGFSKHRINDELVVDLHIAGEKGNADIDLEPQAVSGSPGPDTPFKVRLEVRGDSLVVKVNGVVLFESSDLGQSLAGPVGFYTYEQEEAIKFDTFTVMELP